MVEMGEQADGPTVLFAYVQMKKKIHKKAGFANKCGDTGDLLVFIV